MVNTTGYAALASTSLSKVVPEVRKQFLPLSVTYCGGSLFTKKMRHSTVAEIECDVNSWTVIALLVRLDRMDRCRPFSK